MGSKSTAGDFDKEAHPTALGDIWAWTHVVGGAIFLASAVFVDLAFFSALAPLYGRLRLPGTLNSTR
jgi:hypothetical protein